MKRNVLLFAACTLLLGACQNDPKADQAKTGDAMTASASKGASYNADLKQSMVTWTGTKPTGQHEGSMMLKSGAVTVDKDAVTGGKFDIDIASIKTMDKDTNGSYKLMGHLQSPDFFDVAKFPTASFEITSVKAGVDTTGLIMKDANYTIMGNLTLKGVTKGISFPAKVAITDASVTTDANFNIDRTNWGLSYGNDESLKDHFIRPIVNIGLHIVANK